MFKHLWMVKNITSLAVFVNKLKADMRAWKEFSEDQEDGRDDRLKHRCIDCGHKEQQIPDLSINDTSKGKMLRNN
uniref:Uncharacterized protein n=1 Tax=Romanomermis culicivorax TaxID=13658 RepID=A0A915HS53_ROMCU